VKLLFDGLLRFLAWLTRRPLLRVRIVEDNCAVRVGGLVFEIENASPTVTSLSPVVKVTFWCPERGHYRRDKTIYDVREVDRELPPFKAKLLSASARRLPQGYSFSWFRVYEFQPRRGARKQVRIRNANLEPLGFFRFKLELWRFLLTGRVKKEISTTIAEFEADMRSRGPH
jgi:hypothetical protein